MLTPSNRTITIASGGTALVGRTTAIPAPGSGGGGSGTPAWLAGAALNTWLQIPNTVSSTYLGQFSGVGVRQESGILEVAALLMGGHQGNYLDNTPYTISLRADVPAWSGRRAAGDSSGYDTAGGPAYFADGTPAPRHTYWDIFWCPERSRYIIGGRFWGSNAADRATIDGFNPVNGEWDAAGTWANNYVGNNRAGRDPNTGIRYCGFAAAKWNPTTDTHSVWSQSGPGFNRGALAWDSVRNQFAHLSSGDNFSVGSSTISSVKVTTGGSVTAVTYNASAAYSDFVANAPGFLSSALDYDADQDQLYFYDGVKAGQTGKIYVVKPNSGSVWDMTIFSPAGTPPPAISSGVLNRFFYNSALRTIFLIVPGQNIYFVRTA